MRLSYKLSGLAGLVALTSFAPLVRAQTVDTPPRKNLTPAVRVETAPAYPLIIRIDHTALELLTTNKIDERRRVDDVILGTHAVGESHTLGAITELIVPNRNDASFDIIFQGRTHTRTVGSNGPALIYSHTDTDFVCTRQITFHPREGLVAKDCKVVAHTTVGYDGFDSSRGLLGRRLIRRIARRRADESREQVRRIAARMNEDELRKGFDKVLNPRLAAMNQKLDLVRFVNLFVGNVPVQFAGKSSKDCLHIGVGPAGVAEKLIALPPGREAVAPIEIWVHRTILGESVAQLIHFAENAVLPQTSRLKILLALAMNEAETASVGDVAIFGDWIVLGLHDQTAANSSPVISQHATSDLTTPLGASGALAPRSPKP